MLILAEMTTNRNSQDILEALLLGLSLGKQGEMDMEVHRVTNPDVLILLFYNLIANLTQKQQEMVPIPLPYIPYNKKQLLPFHFNSK